MYDAITLTFIVLAAMLFAYTRGRVDGKAAAAASAKQNAEAMTQIATDIANLPVTVAVSATEPFEPPVAVGERFTYLGIPMLCTCHAHHQPLTPPMDCVKAEYVADDGTLRLAMWTALDVQALRAEINRANAPGVEA